MEYLTDITGVIKHHINLKIPEFTLLWRNVRQVISVKYSIGGSTLPPTLWSNIMIHLLH